MPSARPSAGLPLLERSSPPPPPGLFADGCLVLMDKPAGPGTFTLVTLLRRLSRVKRVGHAGTLDPFASGLVVLLCGPACRRQDEVMGADKRYAALLRLGQESDSHDRTGRLAEPSAEALPPLERILAELPRFTGEIDQVPPMHSAVQIDGKRLYTLARKGISVERPPRRVQIRELACLSWRPPFLELDIQCGKGMYVRSLARDLGRVLGCGALVEELRRTRIGAYDVERALTPDGLTALLAAGPADREVAHAS
jgi:tRNA pseudouridine55 synthase